MTTLILLPLEAVSSYLTDFSKTLVDSGFGSGESLKSYNTQSFTDSITMSILQVDIDVFLQLFEGGFISKRPMSKYICSVGQVLDECAVYDNDTVVTDDSFYQMVQHSTTGNYLWAQNESIQMIDLIQSSYAIEYISCFDNNSLLSSAQSVQIFSFQYLNLSSDTKFCRQLLTGIGIPKDLQLPPDWPNLKINEVTASAVIYILLVFASWLFLVFFALSMKSFIRGTFEVQFATFYDWSRKFNGDIFGKVKIHVLNVAYFFTGFLIILLTQNAIITMVLLITVATMNIHHGLSSICIAVLGVELASVIGAFTQAKQHSTIDVHIRIRVATGILLYAITGLILFHVIPLIISGKSSVLVVAKYLSQAAYSYSWWPITYLVISFVFIPLIVLLLTIAGWQVFVAFLVVILCLVIGIAIINALQIYYPTIMPHFLHDWTFLPAYMRSLKAYEDLFINMSTCHPQKEACVCPCGFQTPRSTSASYAHTPSIAELQDRARSSLSIGETEVMRTISQRSLKSKSVHTLALSKSVHQKHYQNRGTKSKDSLRSKESSHH